MQYFYEDSKGNEVGPVDQDLLIDRAKSGIISPQTPVRNSMVKTFKEAEKISCLKNVFSAGDANKTTKSFKDIAKNLHRSSSSIKAPEINYRVMAFFLDMVVCTLLVLISYNILKRFGVDVLGEEKAMDIFMASVFCLPIAYYTFTLGLKAQTFGYWFFGIMVIKGKEEEVFVGRAFFMSLFFILTLPVEPLFIFIFRKGLHESLTGTRVVNVRLG